MNVNDPSLRLFCQTLAGGMLFIRDGTVVVAVERPFAEEARKLQDRLNRYAREVAEGELGKLTKKIGGIQDELDRYGQELMKTSKKDELRKLADTAIVPAIKRVKDAVGELQAEIKKAEDQLGDSEEQKMIATYEAEAARLVLERTVPLKTQADLRVERAKKVIRQAKLAADIEVLRGEQSLALLRAAEIKVARLEDLVRNRFDRCLANGVNPLGDRKAAESLPPTVASLRGVLYGHGTPEDRYNRPLIDASAAECLGMIRWCQMLGFTDGEETPVGLYAELASAVAGSDPLWTGEAGAAKSVGGRIRGIGKRIDALYLKRAVAIAVKFETWKVVPSNIVWRHGGQSDLVEAIVADRWYGDSSRQGNIDRNMVLGVFRCGISVSGSRKAGVPRSTEGKFPEAIVSPDADHAHFVVANRIDLLVKRGNFYFVVLPPGAAYTHLGQSVPLVSRMTLSRQQAGWSPIDALYEKAIRDELGVPKAIDITGALGEWTVLILSSKANDEDDRKQIIEKIVEAGLDFTLKVPCLKVKMESISSK